MPAINSPYFDIAYGWAYGEDGWNPGMDQNLLRLSFLAKNAVNEFVDTLPASPGDGYSCILNTDNLAYFWVEGSWVFIPLEVGYEFTVLSNGSQWRRTSSGYQEIPNSSSLNDRVESLEESVEDLDFAVETHGQQIEALQEQSGGIISDASSLPVTSDGGTLTLSAWMEYVRNRENHTGTQDSDTISDFEEAVVNTVNSVLDSDTLYIEYEAGLNTLNLEVGNSYGRLTFIDNGVLEVPEQGSISVDLTENITNIVFPDGEFLNSKLLHIQFIQNDTTPYTVTGWPVGIHWETGVEPTVSDTLSSITMVHLVNIDNRGWVGYSLESAFVKSVVPGDGILVDSTDPSNPVVSLDEEALSDVAISGSYSDLTDTPALGTASAASTEDFDAAGAAEAVSDALTLIIDERMSSAARSAVDALDSGTATLQDLILALQAT